MNGETLLSGRVTLHSGDSREVLKTLADNSIDSCVCDPPYALVSILKRFGKVGEADDTKTSERIRNRSDGHARTAAGFMGQKWDTGETAFDPSFWADVLRVLKPGGHLVALGGTRTYHRQACAIEDAGFEIRDMLSWLYGSGFPKSHDVSKGIDKAAGAEREILSTKVRPAGNMRSGNLIKGETRADSIEHITAPATAPAIEWQGWGTALKPAVEPVLFGTKPVTIKQHFAVAVEEITAILFEAMQWSSCDVSDAEIHFCAIQAKCIEAANSVLDNARMRSLESIGIAKSAARSSTFSALASCDLIKIRACSALSHVAPNGSEVETQDQATEHGLAANILIQIMAISTSAMTDGMSPSIVASWESISDELLNGANKFTIETATKLTIALRTLNSSLLPSISTDTGNFRPNCEPICFARKPLSEGTVAANVLKWGTGAINVDGCRVELDGDYKSKPNGRPSQTGLDDNYDPVKANKPDTVGRWPANVLLDGSDEVLAGFPETSISSGGKGEASQRTALAGEVYGKYSGETLGRNAGGLGDSGSAARFFYTAKADSSDRIGSKHPTVKPVDLMQWLVRLVTPKGGTVLDPFAGTGTTGEAAFREGFSAILIEREEEYQHDIRRRMALVLSGPDERARESIKAKTKDKPVDPGPLFGWEPSP